MERPVTRFEVNSALAFILSARGISASPPAVEVLMTPDIGKKSFLVVASAQAGPILREALLPITGSPHPTVADIWILDERQALIVIETAHRLSTKDQPDATDGTRH
jgi:hypothetical protein